MTIQQISDTVFSNYPIQMPIDHPLRLRHYAERLLGWRDAHDCAVYRSEEHIMKRVIIVGSSGSGKSTLARGLGKRLSLPVVHLDRHFWHAGWVGTPFRDWQTQIEQLAAGERWIMDGNYRSTLEIRAAAADTIIFLDLPRTLCVARAIKRRFQYAHKQRPDMAQGCQEHIFDPYFPLFLRRIWNYSNRAKPQLLKKLSAWEKQKTVIHLTSTTAVNHFLACPHLFPHGINQGTPQLATKANLTLY
ncbi:MAG: hypothetical protein AAF614_07425 [Chloroflexota bacterium]